MNTFFGHFQLSTLDNRHLLGRLVACSFRHVLNVSHNLVALKHFSEDNMLAVKPAFTICQCRAARTEELAYLVTTVVMKN